ncbi:MAG TPA: DUF433 domain-containing protein [Methanosarcinales archaeon]|nr:DUF433 domain-containing protein [Methanosarcinales archaeon]
MDKLHIEETEHPHIVKVKEICGGNSVIKGTRMTVWCLIGYFKLGMNIKEILEGFPFLTLSQIYDALSYYYDHKDEVEEQIKIHNDIEHWMKVCPPGTY